MQNNVEKSKDSIQPFILFNLKTRSIPFCLEINVQGYNMMIIRTFAKQIFMSETA